MMKNLNAFFVVMITTLIFSTSAIAQAVQDDAALERVFLESNTQIVIHNRNKLIDLTEFVKKNELFENLRKKSSSAALTNDERQIIREAWSGLLYHHLQLNHVINDVSKREETLKDDAFRSDEYFTIEYAAFLAQYRSAIDFIRAMRQIPSIDKVLNEPNREIGLEKNTFKSFKFDYLNIEKYGEFFANRLVFMKKDMDDHALNEGIKKDAHLVSRFNRGKAAVYTLKNAGAITTNILFKIYFPLQKNISEWMGDERVARGDEFLITNEQIKKVHSELRAGDVLIERRNWYVSNIGLPGFWPHAALYLGRPDERAYLEEDEDVRQWVREQGLLSGSFEELLKTNHPDVYEESLGNDNYGHPYRVLEAMSEGVVFTSLEHSADADSLAVIRPKLPTLDIAKGLLTSLKYKGRPYDFNFDFRTDSEVVCSELIFYAYQPTKEKKGIDFPVTTTLGRPVVTPNNIIKDLSETFGSDKQQFDFILFLDGNDKKREATFSDIDALKLSWSRPKWFIFTQDRSK